jgi:hypothetical protein
MFCVAGFIALAAGLYEIDRREKSTAERLRAEIEQRVQTLADQIRILNDRYAMQVAATERRFQAL